MIIITLDPGNSIFMPASILIEVSGVKLHVANYAQVPL